MPENSSPLALLSDREQEIAQAYAAGESYRQIAEARHIAPNTVRSHLQTIYRKLGVNSKLSLAELLGGEMEKSERRNGPRIKAGRRSVTVVAVALEGIDSLACADEPEAVDAIVARFRGLLTRAASEGHGHPVTPTAGTGFLVFGLQQAEETSAEQALRAAFALAGLWQSTQPSSVAPPELRLGIVTGNIALPSDARTATAAITHFLNSGLADAALAMAAKADSGRPVACLDTLHAARIAETEETLVTERPRPGRYVLRLKAHPLRFMARQMGNETPWIGRERELDFVRHLLQSAATGLGGGLMIRGDAGIGKSRLVKEALNAIGEGALDIFAIQCEPYDQTGMLAPIARAITSYCAGTDQPVAALEALIAPADLGDLERRIVLEAIGQTSDVGPLPGISAERRREIALRSLEAIIGARAKLMPLILLVEDLHWADSTTLDWLQRMMSAVNQLPLAILCTSRPGGALDLSRDDIGQISLSPLTDEMTERIVLTNVETDMETSRVQTLVRQAEGNPLFAEELARSGNGTGRTLSSVDGLLAARVEAVGPACRLAETASVIGRDFDRAQLLALSGLTPGIVDAELDALVDARVIARMVGKDRDKLRFRHVLLRDAAYRRLEPERRKQLHGRMAELLGKSGISGAVAEHLHAADKPVESLQAWLRVMSEAIGRAACQEVNEAGARALVILDEHPDRAALAELELNVLILRGVSLQALEGYAGEEVLANYARAEHICRELGARQELFGVMRGIWVFYLISGELERAMEIARQLFEMANMSQHKGEIVEASYALGEMLVFHDRDIAGGVALLRNAIQTYDPAELGHHAQIYGQDPGVFCMAHAAYGALAMGDFEGAEEEAIGAIELAREIGHPLSLAAATTFAAWHFHLMGRSAESNELAQIAFEVSKEQLLPAFQCWSSVLLGMFHDIDEQIETALSIFDAIGMNFTKIIVYTLVADHALQRGSLTATERYLEPAMHRVLSGPTEPCNSIETWRIAGSLRHAQGKRAESAEAFETGWRLSEATGAYYFGLRLALDAMSCGDKGRDWTREVRNALDRMPSRKLPVREASKVEALLAGTRSA